MGILATLGCSSSNETTRRPDAAPTTDAETVGDSSERTDGGAKQADTAPDATTVRVATFNASLSRDSQGQLAEDLKGGDDDSPGDQSYGNDAFGFGVFPGQYGMVIFSRHPIDTDAIRTFRTFRWADMPEKLMLEDFYSSTAPTRVTHGWIPPTSATTASGTSVSTTHCPPPTSPSGTAASSGRPPVRNTPI